jgi:hypothetical protein
MSGDNFYGEKHISIESKRRERIVLTKWEWKPL